jgi:hypothetical protein
MSLLEHLRVWTIEAHLQEARFPNKRSHNSNSVWYMLLLPIPVAVRSKAWVFARSLTRIVGSIPPGTWMSVSCECCVLSGRGLCDGLVTRPEESYRLWCVSNVFDHETSTKRGGPGPYRAVEPYKKKNMLLLPLIEILPVVSSLAFALDITHPVDVTRRRRGAV